MQLPRDAVDNKLGEARQVHHWIPVEVASDLASADLSRGHQLLLWRLQLQCRLILLRSRWVRRNLLLVLQLLRLLVLRRRRWLLRSRRGLHLLLLLLLRRWRLLWRLHLRRHLVELLLLLLLLLRHLGEILLLDHHPIPLLHLRGLDLCYGLLLL